MDEFGAAAEARYRERVPQELTEVLGRAVIESTAFAADDVEDQLQGPEARTALPHWRRALIETRLAGVKGMFPDIEVETVRNVRLDPHRELRLPGIVITEHLGSDVERRLRFALFRESLGEMSQLTLEQLSVGGPPPVAERELEVWAAVAYGIAEDRPDVPSFLKVVFPRSDGRWEHAIDLTDLVPSLAAYPESPVLVELRQQRRRGIA